MGENFLLGDILSVTTGKLLSPQNYESVYRLVSYVKGGNLRAHQLPGARRECAPFLLEQFPQLRDAGFAEADPVQMQEWLRGQIAKFGEFLEVEPFGAWKDIAAERFEVEIGDPFVEGPKEVFPKAAERGKKVLEDLRDVSSRAS